MGKVSTLKIAILSIVAVLLTAAIGFTGYYFIKYSAFAGNKDVIDFTSMSREEIDQYLIDNSIKPEYVVFEEQYSEEIEEGKIISQSILPGEGKFKEVVTIIISKGFDPTLIVELPQIDGMMHMDIMQWFEDNHFTNVSYEFYTPEKDNEYVYGQVISLSKSGSARRNEEIKVIIADNLIDSNEEESDAKDELDSNDELITLIDFKGYTIEKFAAWAHNHGLKYWVYEVNSDEYKKGDVISQSPAVGAKAKKGTTITMKMSLGPSIKVDNLVGKSIDDAKKFAEENGLKLEVKDEYSRTVAEGKIISTTPKTGASISEGDTLTIVKSKGTDLCNFDGSQYIGKPEKTLTDALTVAYSKVKTAKTSKYSDSVTSGNVISCDKELSILSTYNYTISLGSYNVPSDFNPKYLSEIQSVLDRENPKGAGLSISRKTDEITTNKSLDGQIKSWTFENKTFTVTLYKYSRPSVSFVASDFANNVCGTNSSCEYTYKGIKVNVTITEENNSAAAGTLLSATSSDGSVVYEGSNVKVKYSLGPKKGGEILIVILGTCETDPYEVTIDEMKNRITSYITQLGYSSSQINWIYNDKLEIGKIDLDNCDSGEFYLTDTINIKIGAMPKNLS